MGVGLFFVIILAFSAMGALGDVDATEIFSTGNQFEADTNIDANILFEDNHFQIADTQMPPTDLYQQKEVDSTYD